MTPRILAPLAGALALLVLWAGPAQAVITNVSPAPRQTSVPATDRSTFAITWQVSRTGAPATVSSNGGRFVGPDGAVLDSSNATLARANVGAGTVTFTETVVVPRTLVQRAFEQGGGTILYRRTFTDGQAATGTLRIALTGSGGGAFRIQHISLRFEDGGSFARVPEGEAVAAFADIRFSGAGEFEARWEVAGPASTLGTALFRPLRVVRRYLAGTRTITLRAPPLPTDAAGGYLLRFRVTAPEPEFDPPELRYVVHTVPAGVAELAAIELASPSPGAAVTTETRFAWSAVPGASHYQLEFYERGGTRDPMAPLFAVGAAGPAAGTIVTASQTALSVSRATLARLGADAGYSWQVRAMGPDGRVIGMSEQRPMRSP